MMKKLFLLACVTCASSLFGAHSEKIRRNIQPARKSVELGSSQAQWIDPRTRKVKQTRTLDLLLLDGIGTHVTIRIIRKKEINVFMPDAGQAVVIGRLYKQMAANGLPAKNFWDECTQQAHMPPKEYNDEVKECDFQMNGVVR